MRINTVFFALSFAALLSSLHPSVLAQQSVVPIDNKVRSSFDAISSDPRVTAGLIRIQDREAEMIREQFRLTEIPAPPFKEEVRAAYYLTLMRIAASKMPISIVREMLSEYAAETVTVLLYLLPLT